MILIIPLGGTGERFKKNNYKEPKGLIKVLGKPIIFYLLDNLNLQNVDFIYIPYNKEYYNFRFEDLLRHQYPNVNFKFLLLDNNTEGALHTILLSLQKLNINDCPIISFDADNFYNVDIISKWKGENKVFVFEDKSNNKLPIYSYAEHTNLTVTNIKEKEVISDFACTGCYGFNSYKLLLKYSKILMDNNKKQNNEFYISGVIKLMTTHNINFKLEIINKNNWICLGTPLQIRMFCNNYPKISCNENKILIKNMRICFDFDNTLVTFPKVKGDYTTVQPIQKNIDYLKYLKNFNNTIIIYTARRMRSTNGNIGKVNAEVGKITFETLDKFDIPYDEIYFGKPHADVYIDDLGISCFDNLEKHLGFYYDKIKPRDFNNIDSNSINTIKKTGSDLDGEIYYYLNIPKNLKDLFPFIINHDKNMYELEKIYGIPCITLYLEELLSEKILINIMNSIKRIQNENTTFVNTNINIYENYAKKLKERYENFDYTPFAKSDKLYTELYNNLSNYEKENKGVLKIIHGDPVLSNIIINEYNKIKFIDMRGKVGKTLTICGDWLYDWAKLYQSFIGYDEILENKTIDKEYKNNIISIFTNYFIELYSEEDMKNLKLITKSLLFTLIPLHNNEKCIKYYNLSCDIII